MFTKTDSQLSLFDVENVFPDALPKDDWSYIYGDRIYSLIDEEQFRHLYKQAEQVNKDDDIITDIHGYGEGNVARGGVSVPKEIGLVSGNTNHERHREGTDRPYHIV